MVQMNNVAVVNSGYIKITSHNLYVVDGYSQLPNALLLYEMSIARTHTHTHTHNAMRVTANHPKFTILNMPMGYDIIVSEIFHP